METTEFQIGDVVRCIDPGILLKKGKEYTVRGLSRTLGGLHSILIGEPLDNREGWASERFELVRRAPASPAQEAPAKWVPVVGERVRATRVNAREKPGEFEAMPGDEFVVKSIEHDYQEPAAFGDAIWADLCNLEPAPMPSGSAGKEEPKRMTFRERLEQTRANAAVQHSPYQGNDIDNEERIIALMQTDKPVALRNEAARKRNIAALARELDQPVTQRFPPEGRQDRVYGGRRWE